MSGADEDKITLTFNREVPPLHDACLIAGDKEFFVTKMSLARHSEHFNSLFYSKPEDEAEDYFVLPEVEKAEHFQTFLEIINGINSIDDETLEGVMKLAFNWNAVVVSRACEEFLINESEKISKKKFDLAEEYHIERLTKSLIENVKDKDGLGTLLPKDVMSLSRFTKDLILTKSLEILGKPFECRPLLAYPNFSVEGAAQRRLRDISMMFEQELRR